MENEFGTGSLYEWIQKKGSVTSPYRKYWSVSVTLGGIDINGAAETIQKAYKKLQEQIEDSPRLMKAFASLPTSL